jgi:hypothetical protein
MLTRAPIQAHEGKERKMTGFVVLFATLWAANGIGMLSQAEPLPSEKAVLCPCTVQRCEDKPASGEKKMPRAKKRQVYEVRFKLIERTPDGRTRCVAEPTLMVLSGKPARFLTGGEMAIPAEGQVSGVGPFAHADEVVEFLEFGLSCEIQVTKWRKSKVRVDATFEESEAGQTPEGGVRVFGKQVRAIEAVDLGSVLELQLERDEEAGTIHRLEIVVAPAPSE